MLGDLNNVQQIDISEIREHCIPLDIQYLMPTWW